MNHYRTTDEPKILANMMLWDYVTVLIRSGELGQALDILNAMTPSLSTTNRIINLKARIALSESSR